MFPTTTLQSSRGQRIDRDPQHELSMWLRLETRSESTASLTSLLFEIRRVVATKNVKSPVTEGAVGA